MKKGCTFALPIEKGATEKQFFKSEKIGEAQGLKKRNLVTCNWMLISSEVAPVKIFESLEITARND